VLFRSGHILHHQGLELGELNPEHEELEEISGEEGEASL
jgi:hypothetical protein